MGYARKDVEATKKYQKKFVRYQEGAEKYSLGLTKFQALAKEAKAVYKIDKVALVNCEIFDKYLAPFREYCSASKKDSEKILPVDILSNKRYNMQYRRYESSHA